MERLWFIISDNHATFSNEFIEKVTTQPKAAASQLATTFGSYVNTSYDPALLSYKNAKKLTKKNREGAFEEIFFKCHFHDPFLTLQKGLQSRNPHYTQT